MFKGNRDSNFMAFCCCCHLAIVAAVDNKQNRSSKIIIINRAYLTNMNNMEQQCIPFPNTTTFLAAATKYGLCRDKCLKMMDLWKFQNPKTLFENYYLLL